jgi:hypothetical protein
MGMTVSELPQASEELVREIAASLNESEIGLVRKTVGILGYDRCVKLLDDTKKIEAEGGMMTVDGKRRRTPGGVFFRLAKQEANDEERRQLFPASPGLGPAQTPPKRPPDWDEVRKLIDWAAQQSKEEKGEFKVKATIVGRPKGLRKLETCVAVSIDPHKPSPLPKGVPDVPDGALGAIIVMIDNRHWRRVSPYLAKDKEDDLVCEGYPVFDAKGKTVILAHRVFTRQMQKEQKARDKQKAKEKKRQDGL